MGLTDDQRAMLRLLAQNDESYEDIAALKGVSVEQVRAEVKAALAAAAAEQEPQRPQTTESRAEFPENPSPPPAEKRVAAEPPAPAAPQPQRRAASLPPQRRRLLLFAAGALAIVAVVLILIAVLGEDSGGGAPTTAQAGGEAAGSANAKLTQAKLEPVDGGDAEGQAVFGRLKKKIILLVEAVGLDPTTKGSSYTVWLYKSPKLALRIGSVKVGKSGGLRAPFQLTPEIFGGVLGRVFNQIYISRTDDAEYARAVEVAEQQKKLPPYSGETVLRGEVTGPVIKKPSG